LSSLAIIFPGAGFAACLLPVLGRASLTPPDHAAAAMPMRKMNGGAGHCLEGGGYAQPGVLTALASREYLICLAFESARRILGSTEPSSNVISLLQCWQLV
jgi:hypothetical protein